jgi:hypothetical protein
MLENSPTDTTASEQSAATSQPNDYFAIRSQARKEREQKIAATRQQDSAPAPSELPVGSESEEAPAPEATTEQSENVLSKLLKELEATPLENLSETEISALAEKIRSKSLSRFGELSKAKKTLEAQLAELKQEQEKGFAPKAKPESNPYSSVETVEALDQEFQRVSGHVEWAEALLEDREGSHPEEIIYTDSSGKEYTKSAIKQSLRDARKAKDIYINEQYKQIMAREQRKVLRTMASEKATQELSWMKGDDNDARRQFEALKQSVKIEAIEQADPEFAIQLERILAHAANSMFNMQRAATGAKPPAALNPPSSPSMSNAAPTRVNPNADRMLKDLEARFAKSQSAEDYQAVLRARRAVRR